MVYVVFEIERRTIVKITITEALQEIKTLVARIQKKRESIKPYLMRDSRVKDPFEKDGGLEKFIREERQSVGDLEMRIVSIRTQIQASNLGASLTIGEHTRSVAEWLTWRREISKGQKEFLQDMWRLIQGNRQQVQQKGGRVVANVAASAAITLDQSTPPEILVNIDEQGLLKEIESMEETLGTLDGRLSLFNATTTIEV
jgi:hypothetical protein